MMNDAISMSEPKPSFVYLLISTSGNTYVGATVDLDHRLKQHNKELAGGAKQTSIKVNQGETWKRYCHVKGFPDWKSALQFEWRWKQISRQIQKHSPKQLPIERRLDALQKLLELDKPTTAAIPYHEWPSMPEVVWESI